MHPSKTRRNKARCLFLSIKKSLLLPFKKNKKLVAFLSKKKKLVACSDRIAAVISFLLGIVEKYNDEACQLLRSKRVHYLEVQVNKKNPEA